MAEAETGKHEEHHDRKDVERVKTAREILEERLAKLGDEGKTESKAAEAALKAAADRAPTQAEAVAPKAALEKEREEWKNEALRARADLDNYQKRIRREMEDLRTFAAAGVLSDVIGALDNLDLTLQAAGTKPDFDTLVTGVQMVRDQIEKILADRGADRVKAEGVPFDPRRMEAVLVEERADVPDGTAVQELRRGYAMKDRVLRAAQVKVSRAPAPPPKNS